MKLLASKLYDPGTAETKATSSLLALTAMDTTNLRNSFIIPSHGMVLVKMRGVIHGATTLPALLLGILDGSTIRGRIAPIQIFNTVPATGLISIEATFSMSGLTPGAVSWDAAYGVETVVASSAIKYGGPNDTTGNNAFGGFLFEVWDPAPQPTNFSLMTIDDSGIVDADVRQWLGTAVATPTVAGVPEVDIHIFPEMLNLRQTLKTSLMLGMIQQQTKFRVLF